MSRYVNWFRTFSQAGHSAARKPKRREPVRLEIEALEQRQLLSTTPALVVPSGPPAVVAVTPATTSVVTPLTPTITPGVQPGSAQGLVSAQTAHNAATTNPAGLTVMDYQMDSEGYVLGSPAGMDTRLGYFDDFQNKWIDPTTKDVTGLVYLQLMPNLPKDSNMQNFLKAMLDTFYPAQVTGTNYWNLFYDTRTKVNSEVDKYFGWAGGSLGNFNLTLSQTGDYFAQLASKDRFGNMYSNPTGGDILRLKYVTHGNSAYVQINPNFAGLLDPVYFLSGGPSFTVNFDLVTRIDIQLPHASGQNFKVLSAGIQAANIQDSGDDLDGKIADAIPPVHKAIIKAVADFHMDLATKITNALAPVNDAMSKLSFTFDQVNYHVDSGLLYMDMIQNPWRQFQLTLDKFDYNGIDPEWLPYVKDHIEVQAIGGPPATAVYQYLQPLSANTPIPINFGDGPVVWYYGYGMRNGTIHVNLVQYVTPKTITGHVDQYNPSVVDWSDGSQTPAQDPAPPGGYVKFIIPNLPKGQVLSFDLNLDYAWQAIVGRANGPISAKNGQQIYIPGTSSMPGMYLTITMDGTRNGTDHNNPGLDQIAPNDNPPQPPPPPPQILQSLTSPVNLHVLTGLTASGPSGQMAAQTTATPTSASTLPTSLVSAFLTTPTQPAVVTPKPVTPIKPLPLPTINPQPLPPGNVPTNTNPVPTLTTATHNNPLGPSLPASGLKSVLTP